MRGPLKRVRQGGGEVTYGLGGCGCGVVALVSGGEGGPRIGGLACAICGGGGGGGGGLLLATGLGLVGVCLWLYVGSGLLWFERSMVVIVGVCVSQPEE